MGICMSNGSTERGVGDIDYRGAMQMFAKRAKDQVVAKMNTYNTFTRDKPPAEYQQQASQTVPATIRMFSGCKDSQTSADVQDVSSFGLPPVDPAEKAGGACTNGMLSTLNSNPELTFGQLLVKMQETLKRKGYKQIPQLSASNNVKLTEEPFTVRNPKSNGRFKALLVGINYVGMQGELSGCVNDVKMMRNFLLSHGYNSNDMMVLTDETPKKPTGANMIEGMKYLVAGAQPGDSLFFHYSGHGSQIKDKNGDEADGMDEVMVPLDYQKNGMITDDTLFQILCGTLPAGVHLVCVFDCCHSGTLLDLPFIFTANGEAVAAINNGEHVEMAVNPGFNMQYAMQLAKMAAKGIFNQVLGSKRGGAAGGGMGGALSGALMSAASGLMGKK